MTITVSTFYKFVPLHDPAATRSALALAANAAGLEGTILLAPEGINATVSAPPAAMAQFLATLRSDPRFADITTKDTTAPAHPFKRLKVKLKREILTFGHPEADPTRRVGTYVPPADWNALISRPDVVLVDTRNAYEIAEGTFAGALDPGTRRFTEFPAYVERALAGSKSKPIAMFCTGGIRCEKATAYLKAHGFEQVYHLEGGILRYLAEIPAADSLWRGRCFVFDERGNVD